MKTTVTYQELKDLDQDIKRQMSASVAFVVFNREKINKFQRTNKERLKILADTINQLMEMNIVKNEDGSYKQWIAPEGEPNKWVFKSDGNAEAFEKGLDYLMKKPIEMFI